MDDRQWLIAKETSAPLALPEEDDDDESTEVYLTPPSSSPLRRSESEEEVTELGSGGTPCAQGHVPVAETEEDKLNLGVLFGEDSCSASDASEVKSFEITGKNKITVHEEVHEDELLNPQTVETEEIPKKGQVTVEDNLEGVIGTVKWFSVMRGYGFLTRDDIRTDVFVHQSGIAKFNPRTRTRSLCDGEKVKFDVVHSKKGLEAKNVTGPDGELLEENRYSVGVPQRAFWSRGRHMAEKANDGFFARGRHSYFRSRQRTLALGVPGGGRRGSFRSRISLPPYNTSSYSSRSPMKWPYEGGRGFVRGRRASRPYFSAHFWQGKEISRRVCGFQSMASGQAKCDGGGKVFNGSGMSKDAEIIVGLENLKLNGSGDSV